MSKAAPTARALLASAFVCLGLLAACSPSEKVNVKVSVDLFVERCPLVTSWMASPLQASVPSGMIDVKVSATEPPDAGVDAGATPLDFQWAATAGAFSQPSNPATVYTCTTAGPQTLTVTVTDKHRRVPCADMATFQVTCKPAVNH